MNATSAKAENWDRNGYMNLSPKNSQYLEEDIEVLIRHFLKRLVYQQNLNNIKLPTCLWTCHLFLIPAFSCSSFNSAFFTCWILVWFSFTLLYHFWSLKFNLKMTSLIDLPDWEHTLWNNKFRLFIYYMYKNSWQLGMQDRLVIKIKTKYIEWKDFTQRWQLKLLMCKRSLRK